MRRAARWSALPVYPFLVAAYPAVFLFATNAAGQVTLEPLWVPLAQSLLIGLAAFGVCAAVLRDARRGALLATLGLVAFFSFGHVWNLVGDALVARRWLLAVYALVVLVGAALIWRGGRWVTEATRFLNVVVLIGLMVNVYDLAQFALGTEERREATSAAAIPVDPAQADRRDIVYLVFDRFASAETLEDAYGYDARPFIQALRDRGFYVADRSWANYPNTPMSLISSLDMQYLDTGPYQEAARNPGDRAPVYRALRERRIVPATLKALGYEYLHIASFFEASARNVDADRTLRYEEGGEFSSALWSTTLLSMLGPQPGADVAGDLEIDPRTQREHTLYQLDMVPNAASRPGPTYVFSHFLVPHPPYVFDVDGSMPTTEEREARSLDEQYRRQLEWTGQRILELVDAMLAVPAEEEPIIIVQADEGPYPNAYRADEVNFRWDRATAGELQEKFGILNAYRLPGVDPEAAGLYPEISPVNSFRVVFNAFFGTDLPLLPDETYIFDQRATMYDLHTIPRPEGGGGRPHTVASTARSASAIGRPPDVVMPSWKARSASVPLEPWALRNASRMRTISRHPVRYDDAWVGQAQ